MKNLFKILLIICSIGVNAQTVDLYDGNDYLIKYDIKKQDVQQYLYLVETDSYCLKYAFPIKDPKGRLRFKNCPYIRIKK